MSPAPLDFSKLTIKTVEKRKEYPPNEELKFGQVMSDHMLVADWDAETGWGAPEIKPYAQFNLEPSCGVFHYAFCCFEGQKAFIDKDGDIRIFRPDKNIARLNKSTSRIALPNIDVDTGIKLLKEFAKVEKDVIPKGRGMSLYLRPTMIGTNANLGVGPPSKARFFIIASPVGSYKAGPVRLKATDDAVRSWPGGSGDCKLGANYAPCVVPQQLAAKEGFTQNLWLFDGYLTEVGMMNFFLIFKDNETGKKEFTTAPLDGLILEGVTRLSILQLARERLDPTEWTITERKVHITEVLERSRKNELLEAFGAGTAAIVSPVKDINYHGDNVELPTPIEGGETTQAIRKWIQDIQYGDVEHEFCQKVR